MNTKKPFRKAFTEKASRKAIAGIIIVTIALAGIAIAVSAEGEPRVGAIMPGAIVTEHLANDAVTPDKLQDTGDFQIGALKVGTDTASASLNVTGSFIASGASYLNGTKVGTDAAPKSLNVTGSLIVLDTTYLNETKVGTDTAARSLNVTGSFIASGASYLNGTKVGTDTASASLNVTGSFIASGASYLNDTKVGTDATSASLNVTGDLIVTTNTYLNGTTIDAGSILDAASALAVKVPKGTVEHMINYTATEQTVSTTYELNTTTGTDHITTNATKDLIITYSFNCTYAGGKVNITKVCLLDSTGTFITECDGTNGYPELPVTAADGTGGYGAYQTMTFVIKDVAAAINRNINITVQSSTGASGIEKQLLIVQAI